MDQNVNISILHLLTTTANNNILHTFHDLHVRKMCAQFYVLAVQMDMSDMKVDQTHRESTAAAALRSVLSRLQQREDLQENSIDNITSGRWL